MRTAPALQLRPSPIALFRPGEFAHPERALARGDLARVVRGVYADGAEWNALAPWDRYLARVRAVAILRPDAVFSHESAAALLGLPIVGDPETVHVLADAAATARVVAGVRVHTTHGERDLMESGGTIVTSVVETAVDLARHRHPAYALAVADAALRVEAGLVPEVLSARNEGRLSARGRYLARWPLQNANAAAESTLESVSRAVIGWLGFPAPLLQVEFHTDGVDDRADFFWEQQSVLGEADGDIKYDGSLGDPVAKFRARRVRDMRLRTRVNALAHWGWLEATNFAPLRSILLGAGLRLVMPEATALLLSMRRRFAPHPIPSTPAGARATVLEQRDFS